MVNADGRVALHVEDEGFTLRRNGVVIATLSDDDLMALANSALSHRQFALSRSNPTPGAIFATPVHDMLATWDALGENVLLQLGVAPSGTTTFELDQQRFAKLLGRLKELEAERPAFPSQ
jgi:hypothetical protein